MQRLSKPFFWNAINVVPLFCVVSSKRLMLAILVKVSQHPLAREFLLLFCFIGIRYSIIVAYTLKILMCVTYLM